MNRLALLISIGILEMASNGKRLSWNGWGCLLVMILVDIDMVRGIDAPAPVVRTAWGRVFGICREIQ